MSQNFIQPGKKLSVTAPYDLAVGAGCKVGSIFGAACDEATSGDLLVTIDTEGVHELVKDAGTAWAVGDKVYWDDSAKECDVDPLVGMLIGVCTEVAASDAVLGRVKLLGNAPSMAEGPQAAVADLVDNSGGVAVDGTIAAVNSSATAADAVKELATKFNALLAVLRTAGIIAA